MALTVGVQTVMDAREVVLVVTGQNKALALTQMIEGGGEPHGHCECSADSSMGFGRMRVSRRRRYPYLMTLHRMSLREYRK